MIKFVVEGMAPCQTSLASAKSHHCARTYTPTRIALWCRRRQQLWAAAPKVLCSYVAHKYLAREVGNSEQTVRLSQCTKIILATLSFSTGHKFLSISSFSLFSTVKSQHGAAEADIPRDLKVVLEWTLTWNDESGERTRVERSGGGDKASIGDGRTQEVGDAFVADVVLSALWSHQFELRGSWVAHEYT
jgi:hypothetical protein